MEMEMEMEDYIVLFVGGGRQNKSNEEKRASLRFERKRGGSTAQNI